jgi:hypothetical protein
MQATYSSTTPPSSSNEREPTTTKPTTAADAAQSDTCEALMKEDIEHLAHALWEGRDRKEHKTKIDASSADDLCQTLAHEAVILRRSDSEN